LAGYSGTTTGSATVQGAATGSPGISGAVEGANSSTGTVSGVASTDNFTGTVAGVSVTAGTVTGSPAITGLVAGVSVSTGGITPVSPPAPPDLPASGGYPWSFSGDATTILDVTGFIDGLAQSVAQVSGVIGRAGSATATIPTAGNVSGRVRIREDDDLEVLQLLGLL
jgi:hypothetical protein